MSKLRTDRLLIVVALLLLTLAGGAFYFDGWMWGSRRARGERIGVITSRSGDVRMKFEDDLRWSRAAVGQDVAYDDAIYSGDASEAKLKIGQSQMTVTQNSLIVLRRDQDQSFLKLNYGTLFGIVAKDEKIVIDTGDGKKIELLASRDTNIVLRRDDGRTQFDVTSGEAQVKIDGKQSVVTKSSRLVFGKAEAPKLQATRLRATKPVGTAVLASPEPTRLEFKWAWDNGRLATDDEDYKLEFSTDPQFRHLHATKVVRGALETSMSVSQSLSLLYRVRAPNGQLSQVERVRFVRIDVPVIVTPAENQRFEADPGFSAPVDLTFRKPADARVVYQLARDEQFTDVIKEAPVTHGAREPLGTGRYFARARGDYGGLGQSAWSPTRSFSVDAKPQPLPLAQRTAPKFILIPNHAYPAPLYKAEDGRVRDFLAAHGFLKSFLPLKPDEFDHVTVRTDDGASYAGDTAAWPREKLQPGAYGYRYQTTKDGFLPSAWSKDRRLEIAMEPPRPLGDVTFGTRDEETDRTPATWGFTPLLFARSYDVEVARTPTFDDAVELKTNEPRVKTTLGDGVHYWRARARDARGRLISAYSKPFTLNGAPPKAVPQFLAKRDPQQVVEKVETKVEPGPTQPLARNGWYAWLGTGETYVKYDQSIVGRGAVGYHQIRPGSQYFEGGYTSLNGLGGVMSYKGTPSEIQIADTSLASTAYRWTTMTVEAMMRKLTRWKFKDEPVTYGMRVGLQMHRTPFLYLDENNELELKMNDMTTATLGFLADWRHDRWKYYSYVRYQFPLSTRSDGSSQFSIQPTFAFDGSVGTSYNLTDRWKVGAFLYGQWHQYGFTYATQAVTNKGFQSLFYSSADLRLGYEF